LAGEEILQSPLLSGKKVLDATRPGRVSGNVDATGAF
jgi:hypothetical protein